MGRFSISRGVLFNGKQHLLAVIKRGIKSQFYLEIKERPNCVCICENLF